MNDDEFEALLSRIDKSHLIRTQRLSHNHITQADNVTRPWLENVTCIACNIIRPERMSPEYAYRARITGGW